MTFFLILLWYTDLFSSVNMGLEFKVWHFAFESTAFLQCSERRGTETAGRHGILEKPRKGSVPSTAREHRSPAVRPSPLSQSGKAMLQGGRNVEERSHTSACSVPPVTVLEALGRGPQCPEAPGSPWMSPISQALRGGCMSFLQYRVSRVQHASWCQRSLSFIIWFSICRVLSSSGGKSLISFLMCSWKCVCGGGERVGCGYDLDRETERKVFYPEGQTIMCLFFPNNSIFPLLLNLKISSCSSLLFIYLVHIQR